ncbi:MAG: reverse transcriptase family protein [Sedimenticola sp.]
MADTTNINFMTWNATGIMTGIPYLDTELRKHDIDICGLSEHWLLPENTSVLDSFNACYKSYSVTAKDLCCLNNRRVGKGGVAFLWHTRIDKMVRIIDTDDDRIVVLKLILPTENIYFIQVYLPTSRYPLAAYKEYIDKICDMCSVYTCDGRVLVLGDFNGRFVDADVPGNRDRDLYLTSAFSQCNMTVVTHLDICKGPLFTFTPYNDGLPSFIDHILAHENLVSDILSCTIMDDAPLNVSRHFPLVCSLAIKVAANSPPECCHDNAVYDWRNMTHIHNYTSTLDALLDRQPFHVEDIDQSYSTLVDCINTAAESCLQKRSFKAHVKPYWTAELNELHNSMKSERILWINSGRPRAATSIVYRNYKESKRIFRKKLRLLAHEFQRQEYENIDKLAELDQKQFWKLVNSKRANKRGNPGKEMRFESSSDIVTDPQAIASGWCDYFSKLYSPTVDTNFSEQNKQFVETKVRNILQINNADVLSDNSVISYEVTVEELSNIIRTLPLGKAASLDRVTYEHLKYGGYRLHSCITELFQQLLIQERVPDSFRDGLIITLHKGHGKPLLEPNSYRAISLTPVISKLYEKLLLSRLECKRFPHKLHPLQHGFQKNKSCKMVSFILQECIDYCRERGSELFTCFLDAEKAFDCVWIDGLMCKLYDFGICGKDLRIFSDMYRNMRSKVLCQGVLSEWVEVKQGTRQGGITSPFLYAVYVNGLLQLLDNSRLGLTIGDKSFSAPTQADDITLMSLSKHGLDNMLEICRNYSATWRFRYNAGKCAVIVFGESRQKYSKHKRSWNYGSTTISETTEYKHLGIMQSKYSTRPGNINTVTQSARGTLLSLVNTGLHSDGLNPITALKLYRTIVLPRALFGCDMWNDISATNMHKLESVHHFCIKVAQSFQKFTRTDCALGMLGTCSVESHIDAQKLNFFGTLCRCDNSNITKYLFTHRLFQYMTNSCHVQLGFVPDLFRILEKYNLSDSVHSFADNSQFYSKRLWKRKYKDAIQDTEERHWIQNMINDEQFTRFRNIQTKLTPSNIWFAALEYPSSLSACTFAARLCTIKVNFREPDCPGECCKCGEIFDEELAHFIAECTDIRVRDLVCNFWSSLKDKFGSELYQFLANVDTETLIIYTLGGNEEGINKYFADRHAYLGFIVYSARSITGIYSA